MRLGVASLLGLASLVGSVPLFVSSEASALQQPNGAPIPSPMGCSGNQPTGLQAAMACACTQPGVCNVGAACPGGSGACDNGQHGTCEATIWHSPNDNSCIPSNQSGLDPAKQASTTPETFHPTCGLTFTVVTRGTAKFQNVFGWYNATATAPAPGDLHTMLGCGDPAGKSVVLDLKKEPAYKGGDIGFFLITPEMHGANQHGACASGDCCPTPQRLQNGEGYVYYSQKAFNPDQAGANSYIHLLVLESTIAPHKFYFAWEDTFDTTSADFTDLVTSVDGVDCTGGGEICDTGKKGICAQGVSQCMSGGALGCLPVFQPKPETCDGLDDDCNGTVDDGAKCPNAGDVCDNGVCVHPCGNVEFPCRDGLTCDDKHGLCVDPACIGVLCKADEVCRAGVCATACGGVTCPRGQTCVGDACVDLCKGVACASGEVCREGTCFAGCAACGGISCGTALHCDTGSGACVDSSCAQPCAAGTYCNAGQCVDACSGVACPRGGQCVAGDCVGPGATGTDGGAGLTAPSSGGGVDGGVDNGVSPLWKEAHAGCACTTPRATRTRGEYAWAFFALLALGGVASRRRPRASR